MYIKLYILYVIYLFKKSLKRINIVSYSMFFKESNVATIVLISMQRCPQYI